MLMSGDKVLLDTNIISALLKGEKSIAENIEKSSLVYIPIIALGELYYGAGYSTHVQKNTNVVKKVASRFRLLLIDEDTTLEYGKIKSGLRKRGTPIPENDIWIAAIATHHKLTLVTRDKHFNEIAGLKIKTW